MLAKRNLEQEKIKEANMQKDHNVEEVKVAVCTNPESSDNNNLIDINRAL